MKSELKILFEDCGDKLEMDSKLKYCFYAKGCYCPPHRGHLDQICKFVKNRDNAKIIVNQIGSESRHGVERNLNFKIMYLYLRKMLPRSSFVLLGNRTSKEAHETDFARECDVFVNLRGMETEIKDCKKEKNSRYSSFNSRSKQLLKEGKQVIFYYTSRPLVATLCATKFVENLIKYKNNQVDRHVLYDFCPKELNRNVKDYVIDKLLQMENLRGDKNKKIY
jgi:hypothetical protein